MVSISRSRNTWKLSSNGKRYPCLTIDVSCDPVELETLAGLTGEIQRQMPDIELDGDARFLLASFMVQVLVEIELSARNSIREYKDKYEISYTETRIEYPSFAPEESYLSMMNVASFVSYFVRGRDNNLRSFVQSQIEEAKEHFPGETHLRLCDLCVEQGIPFERHYKTVSQMSSFGSGSRQFSLLNLHSSQTSHLGSRFATNKSVAAEVFAKNGLPAPRQFTVRSASAAVAAAKQIGFPVVIKPQNTDRGVAVMTGIENQSGVEFGYREASKYGPVIVQRHLKGFDYRIVVVNKVAHRVYERIPAHVVGDSGKTISQLIDDSAKAREQDLVARNFDGVQKDDPQVLELLKRQGYGLEDIPRKGERVWLRTNSNVSTGGIGSDATDRAHPDNLRLAEHAAAAIGLDIAGVDLISPDISKPWSEIECGICEINPTPAMNFIQDSRAVFGYMTPKGPISLKIPVVYVLASDREEDRRLVTMFADWVADNIINATIVRDRSLHEKRTAASEGINCGSFDRAIDVALMRRTSDFLCIIDEKRSIMSEQQDLFYVDSFFVFDSDEKFTTADLRDLEEFYKSEVVKSADLGEVCQKCLSVLARSEL